MRRIILFSLGLMFFAGCVRKDRLDITMTDSYVCAYYRFSGDENCLDIKYIGFDEENHYFVFDFGGVDGLVSQISKNENKYVQYVDICQKHNDVGYVRKMRWLAERPFDAEVYFDIDPVSISVVSDADFDERHPAGVPLDNVFRFRSRTPYPFIKSGYAGETFTYFSKTLSELTPEEMVLSVFDEYQFEFEHFPSYAHAEPVPSNVTVPCMCLALPREKSAEPDGKHTFTVTINDDYGRTFTGKVTVDFAVDSVNDAVE